MSPVGLFTAFHGFTILCSRLVLLHSAATMFSSSSALLRVRSFFSSRILLGCVATARPIPLTPPASVGAIYFGQGSPLLRYSLLCPPQFARHDYSMAILLFVFSF